MGLRLLQQARYVKEYLLYEERSPLSMLPAPLNLVPIAVCVIHYLVRHFALVSARFSKEGDLGVYKFISLALAHGIPKEKVHVMSFSGTASDALVRCTTIACEFFHPSLLSNQPLYHYALSTA